MTQTKGAKHNKIERTVNGVKCHRQVKSLKRAYGGDLEE